LSKPHILLNLSLMVN